MLPGGATPGQLARLIREDEMNVRPRLSELRAKKLVRDSGLRGLTHNGKACIVWVINEGESYVEEETTEA